MIFGEIILGEPGPFQYSANTSMQLNIDIYLPIFIETSSAVSSSSGLKESGSRSRKGGAASGQQSTFVAAVRAGQK